MNAVFLLSARPSPGASPRAFFAVAAFFEYALGQGPSTALVTLRNLASALWRRRRFQILSCFSSQIDHTIAQVLSGSPTRLMADLIFGKLFTPYAKIRMIILTQRTLESKGRRAFLMKSW